MDKICYTDVDSTILDYNSGFEDFLRSKNIDIPYVGALRGHNRLSQAIGVTEEQEYQLVHEFFDDPGFYNLPACDGAAEPLQALYRAGWRFVAITACPIKKGVKSRRWANLEDSLGIPFMDVVLSGFDVCKGAVLSEYQPTVYVEDHYSNAIKAHQLGYRTFLIDLLHNHHHVAPMTRVKSWQQIQDALMGAPDKLLI